MDPSTILLRPWLVAIGIVFLLSSTIALALNKRQRDSVLERLRIHRRRASGASTPPRSLSPEKSGDSKEPLGPDYATVFPPSRRSVLPELAQTTPVSARKLLLAADPPAGFLSKNILPMTQSYDLETNVPKYTPTGFSTAEIKAMGDFPAYDILSGVPLPQAYTGFDHTKAIPRPYRPLRWAYHQTMCRISVPYIDNHH